jgi:hypothetical protein
MDESNEVHCAEHGKAMETFVCGHLADDPYQIWYSLAPNSDNKWPDAWCSSCHVRYLLENEWNESNEDGLKAKLFCNHCYDSQRKLGTSVYVS